MSELSSSNRSDVPPFFVMEVMRAAEARERAGERVLHLEVGQPSTSAPAGARKAVREVLDDDNLGYTGAAGRWDLRQRIAQWYQDRYGLAVGAHRIIVTTGASGSCVLAFLAAFEHGDRVGVLEPGYPCYRNDLLAFGAEVVAIPVGHDEGFKPTPELLDRFAPMDGLVLASPANPSGTVLSDTELRAVVEWCAANRVRLIVDEIYHGIVHGKHPTSAVGLSDDVIVFNSFSKYFSMTGWRLGWIVAPENLVDPIERLAQNLTVAPPTVSQVAALAAFDCEDELEANVAKYQVNRDIVVGELTAMEIGRLAPSDGAFYVWVDVSKLCRELQVDSSELCRRWLAELGIAVTPGVDFDQARGNSFVRFSYAGATEDTKLAMERLGRWMGERPWSSHEEGEPASTLSDGVEAVEEHPA